MQRAFFALSLVLVLAAARPLSAATVDGIPIHSSATGTGPVLVFVHGWMGNVRWWDEQRDTFAATRQTGDTWTTVISTDARPRSRNTSVA